MPCSPASILPDIHSCLFIAQVRKLWWSAVAMFVELEESSLTLKCVIISWNCCYQRLMMMNNVCLCCSCWNMLYHPYCRRPSQFSLWTSQNQLKFFGPRGSVCSEPVMRYDICYSATRWRLALSGSPLSLCVAHDEPAGSEDRKLFSAGCVHGLVEMAKKGRWSWVWQLVPLFCNSCWILSGKPRNS